MKNLSVAAGCLAAAIAFSPLSGFAQEGPAAPGKTFGNMIRDFNLTPDQQAKLKAQHEQMRNETKPVYEQMKKIRENVKEELLKDKPSRSALDTYADQLAQLHRQIIQKRHERLLETKAVLTPEQYSKLVNREWKAQGKKKGGTKGPRPGRADDR